MALDFDISILMPSYNQGSYIEEAIQSVLSQGDLRIQLIVMDGGSSDQTPQILRRYSNLIQCESRPDRGQAHALNKALALAEAPIIGWLNSDDKYLPGAFEKILKQFSRNQNIALIHGGRVMIDSSSRVIGWAKSGPFQKETRRYNICSETAFWRRDCIPNHRFREELRFAIDTHFLGLIASKLNTLYIPSFIGCFRCHAESKSSNLWYEYAIPESTAIWLELFGEPIDHSISETSRGLTIAKLLEFAALPLPISSGYVWHKLLKCSLSRLRGV